MKRLLTPLAAACLLASSIPHVAAAPYSAMVVFGDSLSDAGQMADADGPPGATRRFTNRVGPTFQPGSGEIYGDTSTMLLNEQLGLGRQFGSTSPVNAANGVADGNNWAVGGYRTDQIYDSIASPGGSVVGSRTRDGYLLELAKSGQRLDSNALFYVNGGGNDFLQLTIFTTGAEGAANQLADGVAALQQAGARYIMVSLLPNVGTTPAISGTPLAPTISQIGADFNQALIRRLEGIDAQIIPLNVPLLFNEILANPASQGLDASQDLIGTCFSGCGAVNSTWGINSATPDPSKLIYNDSVHPTTHVQKLLADYNYALLSAPWELTLLPEMAHGSLRAHQDQLRSQLLADWQAWQGVGQWRSFVSAGGQRLDYDSQHAGASGDGNGYSLNLGTSYRLNQDWRLGVAGAVAEQKLEAGRADSDYKLRSYLLTAFAQYQHERWWADASASAGYLDYDDLKRKFELGKISASEKGDSDGKLWAFSGRLGYDIAQHADSAWHLSPFVSADYAKVEVDGYRESGERSTALGFADQQRTSKRLGVGLQGRWQVAPSTLLFAEVAHEKEFEDDPSHLRASLNSLPSLSFKLEGYEPDDRLQRLSLGFSQQLAKDLSLRGAYSLRKGSDDQQQGVGLALSLDW
jgi:outer membrane lipase/esterase